MFLGHARGKVGSVVFSRANGKQITRTRAEVVKNPKTDKQLIQRILLNTVAQAYSAARNIADHSFEGKMEGQECMSEFSRLNLQYLRTRLSQLLDEGTTLDQFFNFVPVGRSGLYAGPWILSKGHLPRVACSISAYSNAGSAKVLVGLSSNTYQAFVDDYGLKRGDQLTFCTVEVPTNGGDAMFKYVRVILDPRNEDGTAAEMSEAFIADGAINKPCGRNEGTIASLQYVGTNVKLSIMNSDVASAAVIVSRMEDDTWKRSTAQMVLSETVANKTNEFLSLSAALNASKGITLDMENAAYLNNAGTGGQQGSSSESYQPSGDTVMVSQTVSITANGSTGSQNISGGSTTVTTPLTRVVVNGTNLDQAEIKAGTTNSEASAAALSLSDGNTKAQWIGEATAGQTLYVFKQGTLWFSIAVQSVGGDNGSGLDMG